ncbi:hypothetical protein GCG54_00007101 [Colletotrichum gloeosporioides]|uniref:Uncharacterized protein n=1 Tax=Colletotrichum gloeosporioides TaxID=474922 RepID=A0A8H4CN49_COLGL|nr:uncharacterized protein GCG54_00007101 [Colletotrichum gloeosporioides]KAF3806851.1 hypothetical protein GCG54_00007101 [Colletotrichum gloeosporioides]
MALNLSHLSSDSSPVIVAGHKFPTPVTSRSKATEDKLSGSTPLAYERDRLIRRCMGREVHVVNLMSLMPTWPKEIHSQDILDEINGDLDQWLKRQAEFVPSPSSNPGWLTSPPSWGLRSVNIAEEKKIKHRKKGNYTIMASVFDSRCKKEKLLTLTKYEY